MAIRKKEILTMLEEIQELTTKPLYMRANPPRFPSNDFKIRELLESIRQSIIGFVEDKSPCR